MFNEPRHFDTADRRLDGLLTCRPDEGTLDRLGESVVDSVMFAVRSEAAAAAGRERPLIIAASARRRTTPRWRIGLVAAAALSAGITLGLAGVAGLNAGPSHLADQSPAPAIAVVGPGDIVGDPAAAPADVGSLSVELPMLARTAPQADVDGIVAFGGSQPAADAGDLAAGVASPFSADLAVVDGLKAGRGPRRLVVAASDFAELAVQAEIAE